jgi:hypothetical protein
MEWDHEADIVAVGSGIGGLAVTAQELGVPRWVPRWSSRRLTV